MYDRYRGAVGIPLRKIFKVMKGFGDHLQFSVFQCDLNEKERILLVEAIREVINQREDRVMIVDTGPTEGRGENAVTFLGRKAETKKRGPHII